MLRGQFQLVLCESRAVAGHLKVASMHTYFRRPRTRQGQRAPTNDVEGTAGICQGDSKQDVLVGDARSKGPHCIRHT